MKIPTDELLVDARNHLRCLPPHANKRLTPLLLRQLADRAELLQAIVNTLPKCWRLVDGEPVQDCPVVLGMVVCVTCRRRLRDEGPPIWPPDPGDGMVVGVAIGTDGEQYLTIVERSAEGGFVDVKWAFTKDPSECANTREAAEAMAARKGAE